MSKCQNKDGVCKCKKFWHISDEKECQRDVCKDYKEAEG